MTRLTMRTVKTARRGKHSDGRNLYLIVSPSLSRKWVLRFTWKGRPKEMGLGSAVQVTLAEARERAEAARRKIAQGVNPIEDRSRGLGVPSFGVFAEEVHQTLVKTFKNEKHKKQWIGTLRTYAKSLWSKPVDAVSTEDVIEVLKSIWIEKSETAGRVRGRIEKVLSAAKAKGLRIGENPARLSDHLDHLLPARPRQSQGHHAAMDYELVPAFFAELRKRDAVAARALEFCILTAARTSEVLEALPNEFNIPQALWIVPKDRMKASREHRVPLSAQALATLTALESMGSKTFMFPGQRPGKPLSNMAMTAVLRRMQIENVTVHGFRSSFRDWAGNKTDYAREVMEAALAHVIGNKAEQAYRRSDAFEKRQRLMQNWADFCHSERS